MGIQGAVGNDGLGAGSRDLRDLSSLVQYRCTIHEVPPHKLELIEGTADELANSK